MTPSKVLDKALVMEDGASLLLEFQDAKALKSFRVRLQRERKKYQDATGEESGLVFSRKSDCVLSIEKKQEFILKEIKKDGSVIIRS